MHWRPYWRWRNDSGLSDSLFTDQQYRVVQPIGTDAPDTAAETQSNPLAQAAGSEVAQGSGAAAAVSAWALPPDRCCSSQFSAWGVATPHTNLQALRQQHESTHKACADDADQATQPGQESDHTHTTSADPTLFYPPTMEGCAAFRRSLQHAGSDGAALDKRAWARAGCTLAYLLC